MPLTPSASADPGLDSVFGALADPTRRGILARLALGELSTLQIAEPFDMSLPAVSKHLTVLERAGLIERRLEGRERRCRLRAGPLRGAADWLAFYRRFWEHQLDRLSVFLEESRWPAKQPPPPTASPSRDSSRRRRSASSPRGRRRKP